MLRALSISGCTFFTFSRFFVNFLTCPNVGVTATQAYKNEIYGECPSAAWHLGKNLHEKISKNDRE